VRQHFHSCPHGRLRNMHHLRLSELLSAILSCWGSAWSMVSTYRSISWSTIVLWCVRLLNGLDASLRRRDIVIQIGEGLRESRLT
jgi:hypothetical protein